MMSVVYSEKGHWLHDEIVSQGYRLEQRDGVWISDNDAAVQAIIDSFDPLPHAKKEAHERIDTAAGEARARYITVAPGQEAVYTLKREQATTYKDAGYPADASPWPLLAQEAARRGVTAQQVADEILATATAWIQVAAAIEAVRMAAKRAVDAISDPAQWQQCGTIAAQAETDLAAI